ncbi:MAG: YdbH domain-containing protein [Pseudomonadales bacterium]|jgi:hypothetical protein|nr:YdbH domain-containing protein [Pseudomonadales bacterium]
MSIVQSRMTAILGRALFRLLAGLLLLSAALWLAYPLWIVPLTAGLLAAADLELRGLEAARPTFSGVEVGRLALARGGVAVELGDARLAWQLDGRLTLLRIGRLAASIEATEAGPGDATEGPGAAPGSDLPDPAAILRELPVDRIELDTVEIRLPATGLRFSGRIGADRERAELAGRLTGPPLSGALTLRGSFEAGERLRVTIEDADGTPALDADLTVSGHGAGMEIEGRIVVEDRLLPGLVPSGPAVAGTVSIALRLAHDPQLRLRPGTQLRVRGPAPAFVMTLAPDAPWTLRMQDGQLRSTGVLEASFATDLPPVAGKPEAALTGRLRLTRLGGTARALDFETDGTLDLRAAEFTAESDVTLDGRLRSDAALTLTRGSGLHAMRLEDAASGLRLEELDLVLASPATLDLAPPTTFEAELQARAKTLHTGTERIDLSALHARAVLAGSADAPGLRLDVAGAGIDLELQAGLVDGSAALEVQRARAASDPGALLPALVRIFYPEVELRGGSLALEELRWPPTRASEATLTVVDVSARTPQGRLDGLHATLDLRFERDVPTIALAGGRLRALESGQLRGDDLTFAARGQLPDWSLAAAEAGALPDTLHVEALELRARRLTADTQQIDALVVGGTARVAPERTEAALELSAPSLRATVPASDLRCALTLDAKVLTLRACSLELLGGRIEIPDASIELATLDGYLPIALQGLDLGAVLVLMQDEALAGDGVLDGALPLRLVQGVPTIRSGYVGAHPPGGRLRYATEPALRARLAQPGLSLALDALDDFRYRELGAFVDYEEDGTLGLRVRLAGANPEVERGRAIEFNLDVTQNLPLLLQSLRLSQTIDEAIERRLEERRAPR